MTAGKGKEENDKKMEKKIYLFERLREENEEKGVAGFKLTVLAGKYTVLSGWEIYCCLH